MKTSHLGLLGLVLAAAPLGACNETAVGTDTVRTQGLWASFEVKATGAATTRLEAKLRVGGSGGTPAYPLTGSDKLLVSIDDSPETEMGETCQASNTFCTGNLGDVSGKVVRVNFHRGSDFENAPNSSVKVPAGFQVSAKKDEVVRGEEDVELTISGGASRLNYRVTGDCIWTEDGVITDGKIPNSAITSPRSDVNDDCEVTVVVTRATEGDLDPNFGKGGRIVAVQERKFTFFSVAKPTPPDDTTDPGDTSTVDPSSTSSETLDTEDGGTDGGTDGGSDSTSAASTDSTSTGSASTSEEDTSTGAEGTSTGTEDTSSTGAEGTSTGTDDTSSTGADTSSTGADDTSSTGADDTSSTGADSSSTGADSSSTDADAGSSDAPDAGDAG